MTWPGQFNTGFSIFLLLSGLWVAWRNEISALGLVLAPFAIFDGIMFLSLYLFLLTFTVENSFSQLLLGPGRAKAANLP